MKIAAVLLIFLPLLCKAQRSCTGNASCTVCKNCRYCKHCNSGGSCGVCKPQIKKTKARQAKTTSDFVVFNKEERLDSNMYIFDAVVKDVKKHAFTTAMWPLIYKVIERNKIDTISEKTIRIYLYPNANDDYYCYFEKAPNTESEIVYE